MAHPLYEGFTCALRLLRRCTAPMKLLTKQKQTGLHSEHAHCMVLQQTESAHRTNTFEDAYKTMHALSRDKTRTTCQSVFFARKRPRDEGDPTLWAIPPCPLPKRLKAHQDPNEGQVQIH